MNIEEKTRNVLKKFNLKADKKLGQNFLISDEVVEKIICESNLSKKDLVIEIGPRIGNFNPIFNRKIRTYNCSRTRS